MKSLHGKDKRRYLVSHLCRLLGVSKQAYYKSGKQPFALTAEEEMKIVFFATNERKLDSKIGCRKMWMIYNSENQYVSRRVFEAVLAYYGLKLRRKTLSVRTTNSMHGLPTYPNLVYSVIPDHPCHIWVADITYVRLTNADGSSRFCYLSIVMDAYSRYILGYYVGRTLETIYTSVALNMALDTSSRLHLDNKGLIHHSDRGVQYASAEYIKILNAHHIGISMTEDSNPKDNSLAERINSTVKNELLAGMCFNSIEELMNVLPDKIDYYNKRRPHMSLNNMTPERALSSTGEIKKRWRSYRDEAILRNFSQQDAHV